MKTIIKSACMIASVFFFTNTNAQHLSGMLEGNPIWVYHTQYVIRTSWSKIPQPLFKVFHLDGDTVVNGKQYKRMIVSFKQADGTKVEVPPFDLSTWRTALIREENNNIYINKTYYFFKDCLGVPYDYFEILDGETLLYDFERLRNDSDMLITDNSGNSSHYKIGEKSHAVLSDGTMRDVFNVEACDGMKSYQSEYMEIIDGIGCKNYLYLAWHDGSSFSGAYTPYATKQFTYLDMFIQNGKIVYKAPDNEYAEFEFLNELIGEPDKIDNIQEDRIKYNETKTIYNLQGQRIARPAKGIHIIGGRKVLVK